MAKQPGNRYPSMERLAQDLNAFLGGYPTFARPVNSYAKARMWAKRNVATYRAIATAAITLLIATLVSTIFAISILACDSLRIQNASRP